MNIDFQKQLCKQGLAKFSEYIKLLLYKENENIFDILDFNDDSIYLNPLFFSYFNGEKNKQDLQSIIFSYQKENISIKSIELTTDEFGRIYLPTIGWFQTKLANETLNFEKENLVLKKNDSIINYNFENIEMIDGTTVEILKYPISLLKKSYYNVDNEIIEVEIEKITRIQLNNITRAYNIIKNNAPEHFELIEMCNSKSVIFNVDTYQRNSFADVAAHGVGFYNAYQKEYDEVFFIDDIAHQTGHVIFSNMIFEIEDFLKIEKETILEEIKQPDGSVIENRNLHIVFHALYTYYTTFICLDACMSNNVFKGRQKHETLGRICFYLTKCHKDLLLIDNPISSSEESKRIFTEKGLLIYKMVKNKWIEMYEKWFDVIEHFNLKNQLYNFSYSRFIKLNPLNENIY
ncbi:hypothetical protein AWE51_08720 [Aquimarina aggregata]|uniref:Uncharacterized protein n=1 Tax=Aquimarina aggregata TaxID=1642818 RepID=A0A162CN99_9FLAO|nr:hypothetical protein [Aquimarina aggregata]KZS39724.1 hypothetical protein AWE51_08720 [Aquimarina aggregata]